MKSKMKMKNLIVLASMTVLGTSALAQQNLGAKCGCPATTARATQTIQSLATANGVWTNLPANAYGGEITGNLTLTCDKIWTVDQKIYVASGATLTIQPGTLIKGTVAGSTAAATALIIERGGKIMAPGTESCPIVFTASADAMDGLYPVTNKGMWGGVILLGKATNNLTLSANGPYVPGGAGKLAVADGLGVMEGFASSIPQDQFGMQLTATPSNTASGTSPSATTYTFDLNLGTPTAPENTSGQKKITMSSSSLVAYVFAGMTVSGTGVPAGTTVSSVSSAVITLSANLTAAASGSYTFTGTYPLAASTTATYYSVSSTPAFANSTYGPFNVSGGLINYAAPYAGGSTAGLFNDEDNSGVMTYVSIRHAGANLLVGSEINGLSLASVGRGTKIEHIEIISCADDNIEIFGGTVNLKYVTTLFGNDDMFDYDLGWKGKAQFLFGMKADAASTVSADNDNGFEADSDDNKSNASGTLTPRSHPVIYNATIIGNSKSAGTSDNSGLAAIQAKELTEGEIYNSIFANFRNGLNLVKSYSSPRTSGTGGESWHNWYNAGTSADANGGNGSNSLKIKCNTFVNMTNALTVGASSSSAGTNVTGATTSGGTVTAGLEYTQFTTTDKNDVVASLPGFSYNFAIDGTSNAISPKNDVVPNPALSVTGCPQVPVDGFFEPAAYRGAFSSVAGENWLSDWTYSQVLGTTTGVVACPTDLDLDGDTDVDDFLIFAPAFNTTCE